MNDKFNKAKDKVKEHLKKHKGKYIGAAAIGGAIGLAANKTAIKRKIEDIGDELKYQKKQLNNKEERDANLKILKKEIPYQAKDLFYKATGDTSNEIKNIVAGNTERLKDAPKHILIGIKNAPRRIMNLNLKIRDDVLKSAKRGVEDNITEPIKDKLFGMKRHVGL